MDVIEALAIERAKKLFDCGFANVQPHSGAQANGAVFLALLKPGDTFLGMSLAAGGHLTHGAAPSMSGKWFNAVQYNVRREDGLIDFDELERLADEHAPKLILAGGSAYPRIIDFARFRAIADRVGADLMVDMAHFAGLVAGGVHPSPLPHAHVVTATTHKTLRGGRGGIILGNDPDLGKKINSAIFPGLQGGPLMQAVAAKAVGLGEALEPEFKAYAKAVVENAKVLAAVLQERGLDIVSGGTDTHLMLVDLRPKDSPATMPRASLERAGITCNKNAIPFDPEKPSVTSGLRLGTPAGTTRGFGAAEFRRIGELICDVLEGSSPIRKPTTRPRRRWPEKSWSCAAAFQFIRTHKGERPAKGEDQVPCAARSAYTETPRSRTRARPRKTPASDAAATARRAGRGSPPSSGCNFASSRCSRRMAKSACSTATSWSAR